MLGSIKRHGIVCHTEQQNSGALARISRQRGAGWGEIRTSLWAKRKCVSSAVHKKNMYCEISDTLFLSKHP